MVRGDDSAIWTHLPVPTAGSSCPELTGTRPTPGGFHHGKPHSGGGRRAVGRPRAGSVGARRFFREVEMPTSARPSNCLSQAGLYIGLLAAQSLRLCYLIRPLCLSLLWQRTSRRQNVPVPFSLASVIIIAFITIINEPASYTSRPLSATFEQRGHLRAALAAMTPITPYPSSGQPGFKGASSGPDAHPAFGFTEHPDIASCSPNVRHSTPHTNGLLSATRARLSGRRRCHSTRTPMTWTAP